MDALTDQLDSLLAQEQPQILLDRLLEQARAGAFLRPSHVERSAMAMAALENFQVASAWFDVAIGGYMRTGALLEAVIALHRSTALTLPSTWSWAILADNVERRGFAPTAEPAFAEAETPDPETVSEWDLASFFSWMDERWPTVPAYRPLALLTLAPPQSWADFLGETLLHEVRDGTSLVTADIPVAWTTGLDVRSHARSWQLPMGSMIGPWPHPRELTAGGSALLLALPEGPWARYYRLATTQRALRTLDRRVDLREAMASSAFVQRLSLSAHASLTRLAKGYTMDAGVSIQLHAASLVLVTHGQANLEFVHLDGTTQRVPMESGDVCGAEPEHLPDGTTCCLRATTPLDVLRMDTEACVPFLEEESLARAWMERKAKERVAEARPVSATPDETRSRPEPTDNPNA